MSVFGTVLRGMLGVVSDSSMPSARAVVGRVRPLPDEEWAPEVQALLGGPQERVASPEGESAPKPRSILNILRTIANHPKLLGPFLGFAATLAMNGRLTRRDSELLALRAAWNCQSDFEWGHHAVYARAAGLSEAAIAAIAVGPTAASWNDEDRNLLTAADQLHRNQQIDSPTWSGLAERFDEAQLVEIPFVVGQYTMLSMVANSTGVELESGFDTLPSLTK